MRYKAFISYSHAADGKLAPALQTSMQRFAKPWYRMRAFRIFRDTTNLAVAPELWPVIESALNQSEFLLFLASPEAARSKWVKKELGYWRENKDPSKLLIVLTAGEIVWSDATGDFDWTHTTAVPDVLRGAFPSEPLFLDFRELRSGQLSMDNEAFLDHIASLATPLHGKPKDEIFGEHIRQHRRTMQLAWSTALVLACLLMLAAWFWRDAETQRSAAATNLAKSEVEGGSLEARVYSYHRAIARFHGATSDQAYRTIAARHIAAWSGYCGLPLVQDFDALPLVPNNPYYGMGSKQYERHDGNARFAVHPSGDRLITTSGPGAREWRLPSGAPTKLSFSHQGLIKALAYAADERVLSLGEGIVEGTQPCLGVEESDTSIKFVHPGQVGDAAFSPDKTRLLTIPLASVDQQFAQDQTCRLWEVPTGRHLADLATSGIADYSFTNDSRRIVTTNGLPTGLPTVWDCATGRLIRNMKDDMPGAHDIATTVSSVAWCEGDQRVLCGCKNGSLVLWNPSDGKIDRQAVHVTNNPQGLPGDPPAGVSIVTVGPQSVLGASAAANTVSIWNIRSLDECCHFVHDGHVTAMAFHPNGKVLACGTSNQEVWLWDVERAQDDWRRGDRTRPIAGHLKQGNSVTRPIRSLNKEPQIDRLEFATSSNQLVVVCGDTPRLLDLTPFLPASEIPRAGSAGDATEVTFVAWDADGTRVALGRKNGAVELWDPEKGRPIRDITSGNSEQSALGAVRIIAFSRHSGEVAIGRENTSTVEIIEVETGRRVGSVEQTDARPIAITFANNDQTLLVCGDAYWWRAERSNGWKAPVKSETSITKDDYPVAVFNSSAGYLAVGVNGEARARPHELRLWNMATGQKQPPIPVSDAIACVAVSADGRRLALGSATGVARVWEIEGDDRRLVAEVAHQDGIRTIALDATGDRLVTCGKSWQLWDVDSARPLSASLNYHWKANTVTFRPKKPGILFQGSDSVIRLWSLPSDLPYEPRRLAQWVEIKTALRRDERGNLVRLSAKEWWSRRTELDSPESE